MKIHCAIRALFVLSAIMSITACKKNEEFRTRSTFYTSGNKESIPEAEKDLFNILDTSLTHVAFVNRLTETLDQNYRSYAYIYNGSGVAAGDINNDGLVDLFFGGSMVSGRMYLNQGEFRFKDITESAGLFYDKGFRTGVNMVDINNDGYLDIYICAGGRFADGYRKNLLYINNGNLTFTEKATEYGLDDDSYSTQSYFFDLDNDGDLDLYLLNHPFDPRESNNLKTTMDKNGKLTVSLSPDLRYVTDRLYRNDNGKFKDITEKSGILNEAFGLSAIIADFNDDLQPDIYVCNDYVKPDYLYINNGDGTFTNRFDDYFKHTSFSSMGSDYADINNDGCFDLMTLDMFPEDNYRQKMHGTEYNYDKFLTTKKLGFATQFIKNTLQLNNCNGSYSDIAMMADVAHTDWSWATLIADYNNNGWKDIYITNGYRRSTSDNDFIRYTQDSVLKLMRTANPDINTYLNALPVHKTQNYLYRNNGNLQFDNVSSFWDAGLPEFSNGAVYADLNNDGYLDLVVNNLDTLAFIMKNEGSAKVNHNFIRFELNGDPTCHPYNTKVEITTRDGKIQSQYYYPNRGFLSHNEPAIHFGLGKYSEPVSAEITWPDGNVQKLKNLAPNQTHKIKYHKSGQKYKPVQNPHLYFTDISEQLDEGMNHTENEYIDFKREPLLYRKYSQNGPALATGDINGDGLDDVFVGGAAGYAGKIFIRNPKGKFSEIKVPDLEKDKASEDIAALFLDVNNDGLKDLVVVSGGNEYPANALEYIDRLYINKGNLSFSRDEANFPKVPASGGCIAAGDINGDGFMDLFIGGRVVPGQYPIVPVSYLLINTKGKFVNATGELSVDLVKVGMVTDASFSDLDKDGTPELILCGEWMPITVFKMENGKYINRTSSYMPANTQGWWESIHISDVNNDGFPDIIAGNCGLNSHFKASHTKPVTLHYKDYDENGTIDPILCHYIGDKSYPAVMRDKLLDHMVVLKKKFLRYYQYARATIADIFSQDQRKDEKILQANILSSVILLNQDGKSFTIADLPVEAQISMVRCIQSMDINQDGNMDLILGGNFGGTDVLYGMYDASVGLVLTGDGKGGFKAVPPALSGFNISGFTNKMGIIQSLNGSKELLVSKNNDSCQLFKIRADNTEKLM